MDAYSNRCSVIYRPPGSTACRDQLAGDRPGLIRGQEDGDERDLRSVHHAARGESGAKSCRSASSGDTPSWAARAASRLGVRSVRVVPGWMQLTVIP